MLDLFVWIIAGFAIGTFAGLVPGIHPNLFVLLSTSVGVAMGFNPMYIALFLISAGVVNSFVNYIPAILLGAPDDQTALSVMPGHRLLMQGRAYEAIRLTVIGGLGATFIGIASLPIFSVIIPPIYFIIRPSVHWLLIFVVSYMVFSETGKRKIVYAFLTFMFAGILGLITLNSPVGDQMLFPLFSGLFGLPPLFLAIKTKTALPEIFEFTHKIMERRKVLEGIGIGTFSGILVGLLPGVGAAQATVISQEATTERNPEINIRKFLIATGGVNTADMMYSLLALYLVGNPRSGIAVAVEKLVETTFSNTILFIVLMFSAACFGAYITLKISRWAVFEIRKINYQRLSATVFALIWILIGIMSGPIGLLVAGVSMAIGMIPNLVPVKRSHCMGVLILPTILFFLSFY